MVFFQLDDNARGGACRRYLHPIVATAGFSARPHRDTTSSDLLSSRANSGHPCYRFQTSSPRCSAALASSFRQYALTSGFRRHGEDLSGHRFLIFYSARGDRGDFGAGGMRNRTFLSGASALSRRVSPPIVMFPHGASRC